MAQPLAPGYVLGMGNPLLDISAHVPTEFFEKYDVKPGTACLAEDKHIGMYAEMVSNYEVEYIAGGAAQNSIRACQWMSQEDGCTAYIGCVGDDANGEMLAKVAAADGVRVFYRIDEAAPTGTCACLINNKERALIANLSAANHYKLDHFESPEIAALVDNAGMYYSSGFFLTVCPEALLQFGKKAAANNKVFAWNISAEFLVDFFWEPFQTVLPYADILFGNEVEAACFARKNGWDDKDLVKVAELTAALPKVNSARPRIVVFTQGSRNTLVCANGVVTSYPVAKIPQELIVDTNGAGDSFVGGFLSQYRLGKPLNECVDAAHYCAASVIQVSGAVYNGIPSFVAAVVEAVVAEALAE